MIQAMQSLLDLRWKPNAVFVLLFSSIPDYHIKSYQNGYVAVVNRVHIIQTQCV